MHSRNKDHVVLSSLKVEKKYEKESVKHFRHLGYIKQNPALMEPPREIKQMSGLIHE
jgi:hypothetical protein